MKIQTTGHNIELTTDIHSYLEKRLGTLSRLLPSEPNDVIVDVVLGKENNHHKNGDVYTAEVNMLVYGNNVYARTEQESLFAAIDIVKDEIARGLRSTKTKKETLWKRGGRSIKKMLRGMKF
jgi:putative sigma-54 modulation protein